MALIKGMTHEEIDAQNIAERYVLRTLPADAAARFEEHFVDCPHCQDRLETVERLRAALKPLAAESAARVETSRFRPAAWPRMAWVSAAAGMSIAAGLSLFFAARIEQTRSESLDWRRRYEAERSVSESLRLPTKPLPLVGATFYLSTTRGAESDTSEPVNQVTVQPDLPWIILSLDRKIEPGFQSLSAGLKDPSGKDVWEQNGLPAISREPLSLALPSTMLRSGVYVLTLRGLASGGRYLPVAAYRLRVLTP